MDMKILRFRHLAASPAAAIAATALLVLGPILPAAQAQETKAEQPPSPSRPPDANQEVSKEKLAQLVAPIALYPDPLLSQVLMASTYPLEVVQAARWVKANRNVEGKALEDAMQSQPWDPSIKSLAAFPDVLQMMNDKLEWTQQLGDAFLAQQDDVLTAVQTLRERADAAGNLKTTKQQKVTKSQSNSQLYIEIQPQDPAVVYVPAYNTGEIYGDWPYPSYPPYEWYPPAYVTTPGLWWGAGVLGGLALWGIANWHDHDINIDIDRYNKFNRTNISNRKWEHNVEHRRGVPYADKRLNDQFRRQGEGNRAANREQFRGRAEAGRAALTAGGAAAGGALAGKALSGKAETRPAKGSAKGSAKESAKAGKAGKRSGKIDSARRSGGANKTAFDRPSSGQRARAEGARGQASRIASRDSGFSPSGGGGFRGGGGGGFRGGGAGFRGGGGRRSDIRVKHDVVLLARLSNGMGLYRFAYTGSRKLYVGVIAQEATKVAPHAVSRDREGYLRVRYEELGVPFQTYEHWLASGAKVPSVMPH